MHDKNGREIKLGDVIVASTWRDGAKVPVNARVMKLHPGADACNVEAEHAISVTGTFTAGEVEVVASEGRPVETMPVGAGG